MMPLRIPSYIWSLTFTPNDSTRRTDSSSVAWRPTSVDWNHICAAIVIRTTTSAMPSQRGAAATAV